MPRNITMDDIAAMAGVTKSTVSRYFNGGSVKESKAEDPGDYQGVQL